jgi:hypothetical protein
MLANWRKAQVQLRQKTQGGRKGGVPAFLSIPSPLWETWTIPVHAFGPRRAIVSPVVAMTILPIR